MHILDHEAYQPALDLLGWSALPFLLVGYTDDQVAAMCAVDGGPEEVAALLLLTFRTWLFFSCHFALLQSKLPLHRLFTFYPFYCDQSTPPFVYPLWVCFVDCLCYYVSPCRCCCHLDATGTRSLNKFKKRENRDAQLKFLVERDARLKLEDAERDIKREAEQLAKSKVKKETDRLKRKAKREAERPEREAKRKAKREARRVATLTLAKQAKK